MKLEAIWGWILRRGRTLSTPGTGVSWRHGDLTRPDAEKELKGVEQLLQYKSGHLAAGLSELSHIMIIMIITSLEVGFWCQWWLETGQTKSIPWDQAPCCARLDQQLILSCFFSFLNLVTHHWWLLSQCPTFNNYPVEIYWNYHIFYNSLIINNSSYKCCNIMLNNYR